MSSNYEDLYQITYPDIKNELVELNSEGKQLIIASKSKIDNHQIVKAIDWERLPINQSINVKNQILIPFYAPQSKWKNILSKAKYSLGGASFFSALFLTGPPIIVLGTVVSLGLGSFGCHKLEQKIESNQNNEMSDIKQMRLDVKKEIEYGINGYSHIRQNKRYCNKIISDEEFNIIFEFDIQQLYYIEFIKKHGITCLDILDSNNKLLLKQLFFEFVKNDLTLLNVKDYAKELNYFSIIEDEINYIVTTNEILRLKNNVFSFETFITRNSFNYLKWINDISLEIELNFMTEHYLSNLGKGYMEIKEKYSICSKCISSNSFKFLIFSKELNECKKGISYNVFKERNGFELISEMAETHQEFKEQLKIEFSKLPYNELTSTNNIEDQKLYLIDLQERKNILIFRWNSMPIQQIITEDKGFFNSIGKEFSPEDWRQKAVNNTMNMSISDIAKIYPNLFTSKILTLDTEDCTGISISNRLADEIKLMNSFESVVNNFPIILFELNFINKNTPGISFLIESYLKINLNECFREKSSREKMIIEKYKLIPDKLANFYYESKQNILNLIKKYETAVQYINSSNQNDLNKKKKDDKIFYLQEKLATLKRNLDEKKNSFEQSNTKIKELKIQLQQLQEKSQINSVNNFNILEKLKVLQRDDVKETYEIICKCLQENKSKLELVKDQLNNDYKIIKLNNKIEELENQEKEYSKQIESKKKLTVLKSQLDELKEEINVLNKKITSDFFINRKNKLTKECDNSSVTGMFGVASAIKNYMSSELKELNEMKEEENLLKNKQTTCLEKKSKITEMELTFDINKDSDKSLFECKKSLEKIRSEQKDHLFHLKHKFDLNKIENEVSKLAKIKENKENIQEYQIKIKEFNNIKTQLEINVSHINSVMFMEQIANANAKNIYDSLQKQYLVEDLEYKNKKNELENEYTKLKNQIEYEIKIKIGILDRELQNEINKILSNFIMYI